MVVVEASIINKFFRSRMCLLCFLRPYKMLEIYYCNNGIFKDIHEKQNDEKDL